MALRSKTFTKPNGTEEPAEEVISQRRSPEGRFLLQVDRQTKVSFSTFEEAESGPRDQEELPSGPGGGLRLRHLREHDHQPGESLISSTRSGGEPPGRIAIPTKGRPWRSSGQVPGMPPIPRAGLAALSVRPKTS